MLDIYISVLVFHSPESMNVEFSSHNKEVTISWPDNIHSTSSDFEWVQLTIYFPGGNSYGYDYVSSQKTKTWSYTYSLPYVMFSSHIFCYTVKASSYESDSKCVSKTRGQCLHHTINVVMPYSFEHMVDLYLFFLFWVYVHV